MLKVMEVNEILCSDEIYILGPTFVLSHFSWDLFTFLSLNHPISKHDIK